MASRPALADEPLLAVGARESGRQDDTFTKLRRLGQKGTDRYLFNFQHYPAVLIPFLNPLCNQTTSNPFVP